MHALLIFMVFQCINVAWFQSCIHTDTDYVCKEIPRGYPAGLTSLILFTSDLGEIDLSIFNSTNLTSVISLKITQAKVTAVAPRTFEKFHNLKTLFLDDNHLSDVSSDWFSHPDALETLRLSNNKITTLNHLSLFGMTNLLTLNLSRNQIHTITQSSFIRMSKLRQLDLSNNNLTNLSVDVLRPLNATKIRLNGNPWDCSCSVHDFAEFLRGLQNVSLLENGTLVCCSSPPELKGRPVWQVQECKILTTVSQTNERPTTITTSPANGSASITKPLTIRPSTLISLIVVLCALVLVICVLSVLYHRKRERKHLQTVQPSLEKTKSMNIEKKPGKNSKRVKCEIPELAQKNTTGMLLRTHRAVVGDEMMSQIYHIYSSGIYQNREPIKRVSSAGPILCTTELFTKQMEVTEEVDASKNDQYYDGCMASDPGNEENVRVNNDVCKEAERQEKDGRMGKEDEENTSLKYVVGYSMDTQGSRDGWLRENSLETDETKAKAGTSMDKEAPHNVVKNEAMTDKEHQNNESSQNAESSQALPQEELTQNADNLPYLTIGADPESQSSVVKQSIATGGTRSGPLRPIRRVLTWPTTAVQWKKQWVQNQRVLNVFPKIIFVTGYRQFQHSICPTSIPAGTEFNALEFLPENSLPEDDVRVTIDGDSYWRNVGSFNAQESLSGNISPQTDARIISKRETFESSILSDIFSKNSPGDESEVSSELFTVLRASSSVDNSNPASREKRNHRDDRNKMQSDKKKRRRVEKSVSRRQNPARAQVCDNPRVQPAGGSPKDDSLLLGNEYTYIDLLHEVVENRGRWTRDRWRQTQINKHKLKQQQSR